MDQANGNDATEAAAVRQTPAAILTSPMTREAMIGLAAGKPAIKPKRLGRLAADAAESRQSPSARAFAAAVVVAYNIVGILDIISTIAAIGVGAGEEANPIVRAMMAHLGPGWIGGKLLVQALISAMVLWFPHRLVLTIFTAAVLFNGLVVLNNFRIAASMQDIGSIPI